MKKAVFDLAHRFEINIDDLQRSGMAMVRTLERTTEVVKHIIDHPSISSYYMAQQNSEKQIFYTWESRGGGGLFYKSNFYKKIYKILTGYQMV